MPPDKPEPDRIRDAAQWASALAALKGSRSYSAITAAADALTPSAARTTSGVPDWTPEALSRGTVSDWITGRGIPTRTKMLTFLVVCDVPAEQVPAWLERLDRIRGERRPEPPQVEPPQLEPPVAPGAAGGARSRSRLLLTVAAVVATVAVLGAAVAIVRAGSDGRLPDVPATASVTTSATASPPPCDAVADGKAVVEPRVTSAGVTSGLTFCPVRLNDGRLPITGPFALAGQVFGPVAQRELLVLVVWGDPRTCDALGNPPSPGVFLARDVDLAGADGRWTRVDGLGYDEAVTIGRQYRFVTASAASLMAIRGDAEAWVAAHPDNPGDYPGVLALPADAEVLATFDVPPGVYPGAEPCREA